MLYVYKQVVIYIYFIHLPMKMELMEGSETSAIRTQTPGNYPKENILQVVIYFISVIISVLTCM